MLELIACRFSCRRRAWDESQKIEIGVYSLGRWSCTGYGWGSGGCEGEGDEMG